MTTFLASFPSPPQGVWHLGWLPIRAYALFIIVGIIVALVIGDRRWVARGGEPGVVYDIALWAVPFGLIGGRLYHVMTDWRTYFGDEGLGLLAALKIWDGGLGIWGAVALGGVGAWIGCRRRGIPLPAFGDAIAPGIVLAQAIGRLGNYFNQELFGRPTSLPWGLKIYERRDASGALDMLNGVSTGQPADIALQPVHPTFLYELIWNVLVFVLLIYVDRRFKLGHGRLFALYVAAYCVGRFGVELLRDDTATLIAGIRINSFTSTFVFLGAVVYIILAPKGREDPATLVGKPHEPEEPKAVKTKDEIPAGSEDWALVEWTRELAAVASTTGVVAGVAVAAEDDEEETSTAALMHADVPDDQEGIAEEVAEEDGQPPTEDVIEEPVTDVETVVAEAEEAEPAEPEAAAADEAVAESGEAVVEEEEGEQAEPEGDEVAGEAVAESGEAEVDEVEQEPQAEDVIEEPVTDVETVVAEAEEAEPAEAEAAGVDEAVAESGEAVVEEEEGEQAEPEGDEVAGEAVAESGEAEVDEVEQEPQAEDVIEAAVTDVQTVEPEAEPAEPEAAADEAVVEPGEAVIEEEEGEEAEPEGDEAADEAVAEPGEAELEEETGEQEEPAAEGEASQSDLTGDGEDGENAAAEAKTEDVPGELADEQSAERQAPEAVTADSAIPDTTGTRRRRWRLPRIRNRPR